MNLLLLIDFQNDFFPLGTVEAKGADAQLIQQVNRLMPSFDQVAALCDAHPANHASFAANHLWRRPWQVLQREGQEGQLLWPMHCVAGSFGAEWAPGLDAASIRRVFFKGTAVNAPGMSAVEAEGLASWLIAAGVTHIYMAGTLLEYSVRQSAIDLTRLGFPVTVLPQVCAGLDLQPGDRARALEDMQAHGVSLA